MPDTQQLIYNGKIIIILLKRNYSYMKCTFIYHIPIKNPEFSFESMYLDKLVYHEQIYFEIEKNSWNNYVVFYNLLVLIKD